MGNELILSRRGIESYLAELLMVGSQLGLCVYVTLLAEVAIVNVRVWRLVRVGGYATEGGLLKLLRVLQRLLMVRR